MELAYIVDQRYSLLPQEEADISWNILNEAVHGDYKDIVERLLNNGADINAIGEYIKKDVYSLKRVKVTPLLVAIEFGKSQNNLGIAF